MVEEIGRVVNHINLAKKTWSPAEKVLDYINKHYMEDITIKKLADYVHLSPTYLCLLFKQNVGKTINACTKEVRISKAVKLLSNSDLLLYEIADRVGYKDANYFAKVFKELTKCTPSMYRSRS